MLHLCIFYNLMSFFQLIRDLGPLEWIFNTPKHHRVHHGKITFILHNMMLFIENILIRTERLMITRVRVVSWIRVNSEVYIKSNAGTKIPEIIEIFFEDVNNFTDVNPTGRNLYCIDKNYGGILIIWDRLFGKKINLN